jgi:hypothetical protein
MAVVGPNVPALIYKGSAYWSPRQGLGGGEQTAVEGSDGLLGTPGLAAEVNGTVETVDALTAPSARLFVFPQASALYLFSDREAATRQPYMYLWTQIPARREEAKAELQSDPPDAIVLDRTLNGVPAGDPSFMDAFLAARYREARAGPRFAVYVLR